jgi:protein gp37
MEKSAIQWTDSTVNFWTGCRKVSEGCKFCYMYRDKEKYKQNPMSIKRTLEDTFYKALTWKDSRKIFTCSWSDFFIEEADSWRNDAWDVIRQTPQHHWQILTKRPERIKTCLPEDWGNGWENVWLGTSIESQQYIDRITHLAAIPAYTRFISAEPLISEIDIQNSEYRDTILESFQWCIIGGESGNEDGQYRYRECRQEWIERLVADLGILLSEFLLSKWGAIWQKK